MVGKKRFASKRQNSFTYLYWNHYYTYLTIQLFLKRYELFTCNNIHVLADYQIVYYLVNNPHVSDNSIYNLLIDYYDGNQFRQIALFHSNQYALQLNLYYDELKICNPLGSHHKIHKLGWIDVIN